MLKKYMFLVAIVLALVTGCDKINLPGSGDDGSDSGVFVRGGVNVMDNYKTSTAIAWVELRDGSENDSLITDAVVILNGDTLGYNSYSGGYMDVIGYSPSTLYDLEVKSDRGDFSVSISTPATERLDITSPMDEAQLPLGNDVEVTWDVQGETGDSLSLSYGYNDGYYEEISLPDSARLYVITADNLNHEGTVNVWVQTYSVNSLDGFAAGSAFFFSFSDNISVTMVPSK